MLEMDDSLARSKRISVVRLRGENRQDAFGDPSFLSEASIPLTIGSCFFPLDMNKRMGEEEDLKDGSNEKESVRSGRSSSKGHPRWILEPNPKCPSIVFHSFEMDETSSERTNGTSSFIVAAFVVPSSKVVPTHCDEPLRYGWPPEPFLDTHCPSRPYSGNKRPSLRRSCAFADEEEKDPLGRDPRHVWFLLGEKSMESGPRWPEVSRPQRSAFREFRETRF